MAAHRLLRRIRWDVYLLVAPPDPIAIAVIRAMQASGITIVAVAAAAGLHRDVVGRWLAGTRSIRVREALRVTESLGLTVTCSEPGDGTTAGETNHLTSDIRACRSSGGAHPRPIERSESRRGER